MSRRQLIGLTGGEVVREILSNHGTRHVCMLDLLFLTESMSLSLISNPNIVGYPGGAALPLFDGLYKSTLFKFILCRHEQGAGHMAEGYATASGKPGVVLVTSGPGSSNVVTPMLDALLDGTPMIVICGQVATAVQGTGAFQETDVIAITRPCTKWSTCVQKVADLPGVMENAFHHALDKRPGPVLIAIPKDVGKAVFDMRAFEESQQKISHQTGHSQLCRNPSLLPATHTIEASDSVYKTAELINLSQRPVICAGHGVLSSDLGPALVSQVAGRSNIPVTTTLLGLGCFDETHNLALQMMGMYGAPYANYAIQEADLILVFGARLDERVVANSSGFAPKARAAEQTGRGGIIQFDIDPNIIGKVVRPTYAVIGDLCETLLLLLTHLDGGKKRARWIQQIEQWKREYSFQRFDPPPTRNNQIFPQQIVAELDYQTASSKRQTIITTGVGQHQMWTAQRYLFRSRRSFITSGGLGTMGFGLPAAIGAKLARPDHQVIDLDGDASLCMTMEEALTASQNDIPVKVVVFNNQRQAMISQLQKSDYGGRECFVQQQNPDFVQLVSSMGWEGRRCDVLQELPSCMHWLLACQRPALLDVAITDTDMVPIVPNGKTLGEIKAPGIQKIEP